MDDKLTPRQERALIHLIRLVGKRVYRAHKHALGISPETPITRLTRREASRLIEVLLREVRR